MALFLLNRKLIIETYSHNTIKTFKDFRVLVIDGSTARLPVSKELFDAYGSDVFNTSIPLARTSMMFDALNNMTLHASICAYDTSERLMAFEHIVELERLNKAIEGKTFVDDLILFDRGYPSLPLMFFLNSKKKHFLIRTQSRFISEMNAVVEAGFHDTVITIPAFKKDRDKSPYFDQWLPDLDINTDMQVRVLVFDLKNGQKEIIVTSLIDQEKFSYEEIFQLYSLRWSIEEGYKFHKAIADLENFSGKSKLAIEQDFFATVFTCNVCALLMQESQDELEQSHAQIPELKHCKYEYKVNRNVLIGIVKNEIIDVLLSNRNLTEYCETLKSRIKKNLVPVRLNRSFPRHFKRIRSTIDRRAL